MIPAVPADLTASFQGSAVKMKLLALEFQIHTEFPDPYSSRTEAGTAGDSDQTLPITNKITSPPNREPAGSGPRLSLVDEATGSACQNNAASLSSSDCDLPRPVAAL